MRPRRFRARALALALLLLSGGALAFATASAHVAPATAGAPRGVHLSITGDARTTMTVMWFTDGLLDPGSVVEFGDTTALGRATTGASHPVPGVAARAHEATMTGLSPGQTVHYRVGGASGWSDVRAFRTDDGDGRFRVVVWGDHGVTERSAATVQAALGLQPDFVLIAGDLSYANGDQPVWDVWFDLIEPLASSVPFMTAFGNHEEEDEWGTTAFEARLALPGEELFFGFDYGNAHFTAHNSDTLTLVGQQRLHEAVEFFAEDVAAAAARRDAGELDHVIVVQHHPLYGNHPDLPRQYGADLIATQETVMHANGVKLVLTAHNHNYERTKPMAYNVATEPGFRDYEDPVGFIHVITGGGGQSLYSFRDPNDFPSWSAAHARRYHVTVLDVDGGRIDGQAIDTWFTPGVTFDRWSLTLR